MNGPTIPEFITVHLGRPDQAARNVTITFPDYIKNVASSEIYPTWPESALRANIYAQTSFALNRVYTEWYRSRGYDFDITNSTAYDQFFVEGRDIFENISHITDELFNDYIRRFGFIEPLFAQYCNGTTVTCDGLSQWGSVNLARQGYVPYSILTYYYGDNIELRRDAPIAANIPSFQETLRRGSTGNAVRRIQIQLNRISQNYPRIPKLNPVDGIFGPNTEEAVQVFQRIFQLVVDGIVGKATWYRINYLYVSVKRLAELYSEGETLLSARSLQYPGASENSGTPLSVQPLHYLNAIEEGDSGEKVEVLQFFLSVISDFDRNIPIVSINGTFGPETVSAVTAFQREEGLPATGVVDRETWDAIYDAYKGMIDVVPPEDFTNVTSRAPSYLLVQGMRDPKVRELQEALIAVAKAYPSIPLTTATGLFGSKTKAAVVAFQKQFGLTPDGVVGRETWRALMDVYDDLASTGRTKLGQYPGFPLRSGMRDDTTEGR